MQKKRLPKVMLSVQRADTECDFVDGLSTAKASSLDLETVVRHPGPDTAGSNAIDAQNQSTTGSALIPPQETSPAEIPDPRQGPSMALGTLRRRRAERIVQRNATIAGFGGIIPLPLINIAAISVIILRMVRTLARLYGVPFEHNQVRSIVISLLAGTMPTGMAAATTSTLMYLVPGSNLIGLAVSSITAVECTRCIGRIFINHFENGGTLSEVQEVRHATRPL
jgi:uncharacterized protein (DUF697 family)